MFWLMLQNDSGMNCEIIFTFVFKRQCLCSKRVKVSQISFLYPSCPPCSFFLKIHWPETMRLLVSVDSRIIHPTDKKKTLRCEVVDYYSLSTASQFPFFRRETASRRQRNIFAFSCRQPVPQTKFFGLRPLLVVDNCQRSSSPWRLWTNENLKQRNIADTARENISWFEKKVAGVLIAWFSDGPGRSPLLSRRVLRTDHIA